MLIGTISDVRALMMQMTDGRCIAMEDAIGSLLFLVPPKTGYHTSIELKQRLPVGLRITVKELTDFEASIVKGFSFSHLNRMRLDYNTAPCGESKRKALCRMAESLLEGGRTC